MKQLRDYQETLSLKGSEILSRLSILYLAMEVRTGKTCVSMDIARRGKYKNVLFLTKKKAISSITEDYQDFGFDKFFNITVINDESMHKLPYNEVFDLVIHDEHHRLGSFPKPSKATRMIREKYSTIDHIYLSGTPSPESYSQLFHQFWIHHRSPWRYYSNFYKWSHDYVDVKDVRIGQRVIRDYSFADKDKVMADIEPYMLSFTQKQAGFTSSVQEQVMYVDMKPITYKMCKMIKNDRVIEGKDEIILADTPAKLQQKMHQLYSGTIKFDSGNRMTIDDSKAKFIAEKFKGKKIAIFYLFIAEFNCLRDTIGDKITGDIQEFKSDPDKWLAVQIKSGREGTNMSEADFLVMYNIDFSATSYWQGRDRMTTQNRKSNDIVWIRAKKGIEDRVYDSVAKKKTYTVSHFKNDLKAGLGE